MSQGVPEKERALWGLRHLKGILVNWILSLTVPKSPYEMLRKSLESHFSVGSRFLSLKKKKKVPFYIETLETDLQFLYRAAINPWKWHLGLVFTHKKKEILKNWRWCEKEQLKLYNLKNMFIQRSAYKTFWKVTWIQVSNTFLRSKYKV